jgi:acetyl-CoA carboxylase biotin carboxyl carrier protein
VDETFVVLPQHAANIQPSQYRNMAHYVEQLWGCAVYHDVVQAADSDMTLLIDKLYLVLTTLPFVIQLSGYTKKDYQMPSFRSTVESMSKIMDDMGITELDLERQFLFGVYRKHIHLSKQQSAVISQQPSFVKPTVDDSRTINNTPRAPALRSPMVGVAYLAPEPGAKPFTSVGASVAIGDTVALIEAMKTFNPIKADRNGVIKEILISDGRAVEFDQPLIVIE